MAQFVIRDIEEEVKSRLRRRAAGHRRSMEEEVREILRDAVKEDEPKPGGLGTEISSLFTKAGLEEEIPELRGFGLEAERFDR